MENPKNDTRVIMTTRIWGMAVAMMAICLPMVGIERDLAVLPILVVLGTVVSTVVVWRPALRRNQEMEMLSQSMRELQHELARLQISSTDDELKRKIEELSLR